LRAEEVEEVEEVVGVAINHSRDLNNPMEEEEVDAAAVNNPMEEVAMMAVNNHMEEVDMMMDKCLYLVQEVINNSNHNQCTMTPEFNSRVIHSKHKGRSTSTCREVAEVEARINTLLTKTIKDLLPEIFLISQVDSRKRTRLLSRLEDCHIKSDMKRLLTSSEIIDISKKVQYLVLEVMDGRMVSDQFCLKIRKNREKQPRNLMAHILAKDMLSLASSPMVITSSLMAHLEADLTMVRLSNFPNMLDLTTKRDPLL